MSYAAKLLYVITESPGLPVKEVEKIWYGIDGVVVALDELQYAKEVLVATATLGSEPA